MSLRKTSITDAFKNELTCALCQDMYDQPQSLIPCLHTFCLNCVQYIPRQSSHYICPVCRSTANAYCKNFTFQNLIDILHKAGIEEQETFTVDSNENHPQPSYSVSSSSSSFQSLIVKAPCLSCTQGNQTGYTCPIPISDSQQDGFGHILCGFCLKYMPARGFGNNEPALNQCCSFCGIVACSEYWTCDNRSKIAQLYVLSDLSSIQTWISDLEVIESKEEGHLNKVEIGLLTDYLGQYGISWQNAWEECLNDLDNGNGLIPIIRRMTPLGLQLYNTRRLLSEDNQSVLDDDEYYYRIQEEGILPSQHLRACYSCTVTVANGLFYTFWKGVVQNGLDQLHRERCQQGIQCETQWRRESHAQRLSHIEIGNNIYY